MFGFFKKKEESKMHNRLTFYAVDVDNKATRENYKKLATEELEIWEKKELYQKLTDSEIKGYQDEHVMELPEYIRFRGLSLVFTDSDIRVKHGKHGDFGKVPADKEDRVRLFVEQYPRCKIEWSLQGGNIKSYNEETEKIDKYFEPYRVALELVGK